MSIAVDTQASNSATAVSTLSVNLTLSAGTGRLLVMGVAIAAGAIPTINTPTWAGSSTGVTQQDSTRTGGTSTFRSAIYTLANPTTGTNAFQATTSANADEFIICAVAFTGVKQTGSVVTATGATGTDSTALTSITPSAITNYLIDLVNMWGTTLTAANYQNERTKQTNVGAETSGGMSTLTNVQGSVPMTWTETGGSGNEWTYHILELARGGPSFSAEPSDVTILAGNTTVLSVTATAESGSLTYQWQVDTGSGFVDVSDGSGGTTSSYTTATLQAGMRFYRCNVTDSIATNPTRSAQVTILSATPEAWVQA